LQSEKGDEGYLWRGKLSFECDLAVPFIVDIGVGFCKSVYGLAHRSPSTQFPRDRLQTFSFQSSPAFSRHLHPGDQWRAPEMANASANVG
jgi:hypothetical protein